MYKNSVLMNFTLLIKKEEIRLLPKRLPFGGMQTNTLMISLPPLFLYTLLALKQNRFSIISLIL